MYRTDYVLRLIEQLARAFAALYARILRRELPAHIVLQEIGEAARQAGMDLEVARRLDPASLLMWLAPTGEINEPKVWLMAELLFLSGLHAHTSGEVDAARGDLRRALALFSRLPASWKPTEDLASAGDRSAEVRRLLEDQPFAAESGPR